MDPIGFELFKNAIFSIADEMALTRAAAASSGPAAVMVIRFCPLTILLPANTLRVVPV